MWQLAALAASLLMKDQQQRQAQQDAYQDAELSPLRKNAAALGGLSYGNDLANTQLQLSRMMRDAPSNNIGLAIQAIGALDKSGSSSSSAPSPGLAASQAQYDQMHSFVPNYNYGLDDDLIDPWKAR